MQEPTNDKLKDFFEESTTLEQMSAFLRYWKGQGVTQDDMKKRLETFRKSASKQTEDSVLEMLDIVEGFCKKELLVW
jgi:hypothetical protein